MTMPATKAYLDAFAKLEANDPVAIAAFASHVGKQPQDHLASFHLKRLLNGATGSPDRDGMTAAGIRRYAPTARVDGDTEAAES